MALGGAWVVALLGSNIVRLTGRTFGADADAAIIGLNGDVGADAQLPAGWYGTTGAVAAATLVTHTIALVNPATDGAAGAAAGGTWVVTKGAAPFRITLTWQGAAPTAPVAPEVYVIWPHSVMQ